MYERSFKGRINTLYSEYGQSLQKFADKIGLNRQTISFYIDGKRLPDSNSLIKICNTFSVSADWLLALSDVRSPSADTQNAVAALGISEKSVITIQNMNDTDKQAFSHLVGLKGFIHFVEEYKAFISSVDKLADLYLKRNSDVLGTDSSINEEGKLNVSENGYVTIFINNAVELFKQKTVSELEHICSSFETDSVLLADARRNGKEEEFKQYQKMLEDDPVKALLMKYPHLEEQLKSYEKEE